MNKIFCCCFLFFIFSISLFLPDLTLKSVIDSGGDDYKMTSTTGNGVLASYLGVREGINEIINQEHDIITGEQLKLSTSSIDLAKIIDKLGLRIISTEKLNSCIIVCGISKLIPYKNSKENYNVQIKSTNREMIIASPKFIN